MPDERPEQEQPSQPDLPQPDEDTGIPEEDTTQSDDYLPTDQGVESHTYDPDPRKRGGGGED